MAQRSYRQSGAAWLLMGSLFLGGAVRAQEASHRDTLLGHPLQVDRSAHAALCASLPAARRAHVYLFFVNGVDWIGAGNLRGLCGYIQAQGFPHAYYAQCYQGGRLEQRIRQIAQQDPQARFVLVGFSAGAYVVRDVTHALAPAGIRVDLLVYIGGDYLSDSPDSRPANAGTIVNIMGHGFLFSGGDLIANGTPITGALNLRLPCRHILLPSRRETIDLLMQELAALTAAPAPPVSRETLSPPR